MTPAVTSQRSTVAFFKALADETRLTIVRLLAFTDLRGGEIVAQLQLPQNAVSYHLKQLRTAGILRDHRSHADARDIYYSLDVVGLQSLFQQAGRVVHPSLLPQAAATEDATESAGSDLPLRVLFLCTHNSARSQLAEAVLRQRGGSAVVVSSAGSDPTQVYPLVQSVLADQGIDPSQHHAKSLDLYLGQSFDYVITVCDRVNDHCPVFPNDPKRMHWSFTNPSAFKTEAEQRRALEAIWLELQLRVGLLLSLPHPVTGRKMHLPHSKLAVAS